MNKILWVLMWCGLLMTRAYAVNSDELLSPEEAFVPVVEVAGEQTRVDFTIADGYYLYQSKISVQTEPNMVVGDITFSEGKEKEDEFFGKQNVYYHAASLSWKNAAAEKPYRLVLHYQGCADAGVCYPPVETSFDIHGSGMYEAQIADEGTLSLKKSAGAVPNAAPLSDAEDRFVLSRHQLWGNLLVFFVAGLGLSLTACMYPLLPIVSSIVVGNGEGGRMRGFVLSFIYVQGLAITYTFVGVLAGLTGSLLTVWLQQAWVVLSASAIMAILALGMFGIVNVQMPMSLQSYFQNQSNRLSGGKAVSVGLMGMLSALIVGPCVAPPLAFALGYIGQTGDAWLGGAALYVMALGTGVPLMLIGTFGGSILPKAGAWMNGVKAVFGIILLGVAVYLAAPFLPYWLAATLYLLLLLVPAVYLLVKIKGFSGSSKSLAMVLAFVLIGLSTWFAYGTVMKHSTPLHHLVLLYPSEQHEHGQRFTEPSQMMAAVQEKLQDGSGLPVMIDFYADWCVSCREMEAKTFSQQRVMESVPLDRLFQIDVTANTLEQRAFLKEYGLYGPPGLFAIHANQQRSEAVLGYLDADGFIQWWQEQVKKGQQ